MKKTPSVVNLQTRLFRALPRPIRNLTNDLRYLPTYLRWRRQAEGYAHARSILEPLHDRFRGARCVVIGNGPSLRDMDLRVLEQEYTFGLNRIYLLFEELGFSTTFFVSVNRFVLEQFREDVVGLDPIKFLNWNYRGGVQPDDRLAFLTPRPGARMNGDVVAGYTGGTGTVTNVALELAFYMGFEEVILIGVDHSFRAKGAPLEAQVSDGSDENHFHPDYFGKGVVWQLPDYEAMESGYASARHLFESDGRTIVDATVGGHLQVFQKVDFEEHLSASTLLNARQGPVADPAVTVQ